MKNEIYDMIVAGGGPAGYTAALYAARAGMKTAVIEKISAGGQMALTAEVENYPGFENGISGFELGEKMRMGAERFGVKSFFAEVLSVALSAEQKEVKTDHGSFYGKTVVLATGANPRKLGVKGEDEAVGRGVSYCATCDGMFYRNKTVVVVGGGNSAAEDALILARICKRVILVHRKSSLKATRIYRDRLSEAENVEFWRESAVTEILAEQKVMGVRVKNQKTEAEKTIACDGVFICIGRVPATEFLKGHLSLDESGYILADESTRTSVQGVYAIGDVRTKALRQIVTAVADGAVAVYYAEEYLTSLNSRENR